MCIPLYGVWAHCKEDNLTWLEIDLRTPPASKSRPLNYPTIDPLGWLIEPLADAYVSSVREANMKNPRLNPILAPLDTLPLKLLIVIGTIDILLSENRTFVQRLKQEIETRGLESKKTIQFLEFEGQIHGWLEWTCAATISRNCSAHKIISTILCHWRENTNWIIWYRNKSP